MKLTKNQTTDPTKINEKHNFYYDVSCQYYDEFDAEFWKLQLLPNDF